MSIVKTLEVPIKGMDCAECTMHVQHAIAALPGVESVNVYLASEKAAIRLDQTLVDLPAIRKAVEGAGYSVPDTAAPPVASSPLGDFTRPILTLFGVVFGVVLFVVVIGEWFGLFDRRRAGAWPIGVAIVLIGGSNLRNVIRATLHRQVISHADDARRDRGTRDRPMGHGGCHVFSCAWATMPRTSPRAGAAGGEGFDSHGTADRPRRA
jgi:Cd2+/Zn2+-exporting ATPase/Cu+-exporting ATPase